VTKGQLKAVIKYHLKNFNNEGVALNDQTVLNTVLSDSDGFGAANSMAVFKAAIRWTFWNEDKSDPSWPATWMGHTVAELADALHPGT
jgi:hypothetical protein